MKIEQQDYTFFDKQRYKMANDKRLHKPLMILVTPLGAIGRQVLRLPCRSGLSSLEYSRLRCPRRKYRRSRRWADVPHVLAAVSVRTTTVDPTVTQGSSAAFGSPRGPNCIVIQDVRGLLRCYGRLLRCGRWRSFDDFVREDETGNCYLGERSEDSGRGGRTRRVCVAGRL